MEAFIKIKEKDIFYRRIGQGRPVMLIHGFGEDGNIWKTQVDFLKDNYEFIVPDLPGSGKSDLVDDMSMEGLGEVLFSLYQQLFPGKEQIIILGHSMGGYILLALAEKYPECLAAMGFLHSTAYADTDEKRATRQKGISFIEQHGAYEFLKSTTPNLFSAKTRAERPELIDELIEELRNFSATALVLYYRAMMARPGRVHILESTVKPFLYIMGEEDNAVPLKDALEQCHLPEKVYIHILSHSAHMGMLEESEKCNSYLSQFLSEI